MFFSESYTFLVSYREIKCLKHRIINFYERNVDWGAETITEDKRET